MTNKELIKALRYCAEHEGCDYYIAKDCPIEDTWVCGADCEQILMLDAADALEAAEKRIAELSLDCELFQQKCMELDAQIPKRGKWVDYMNSGCKCSVCNSDWGYFTNDTERFNYCPNCGAKMRGANDDADC